MDQPLESIATGLVIGLLVMFAVLDMSVLGVSLVERVAYVLLYGGTVLAGFVIARTVGMDQATWALVAGWFLLVSLWLLPTLGQTITYPSYILADLLTVAFPAVLVLASGHRLFSDQCLRWLATGLFVAACLAPLVGVERSRFEPPSTLLMALVWSAILRVDRVGRRLALVAVATILLVLAFMSGQRTALVVWLLGAGFVTWNSLRAGAVRGVAALFAVALVAAVSVSAAREQALDMIAGHRVGAITRGEQDESLLARVKEASDVLSTIRREGSTLNYLVGFGHGATYRPSESYLTRNVTAEGRVHNVHIGPLMIFFRYGCVGLLIYAWVIKTVVSELLRVGQVSRSGAGIAAVAFAVATGGYLLEGLMFNVLVDPLFSFALAGLLSGVMARREVPGVLAVRACA